jgi:hypothetical protein
MSTKSIQLQVCAGLANRLRATVSGICAAEELGCPITISWPAEVSFGATFTDLFDLDASDLPSWITFDSATVEQPTMCLTPADWSHLFRQNEIRIKSYGEFRPRTPRWFAWLRALRPRKEFLPCLEDFLLIGVHIRRTDNRKAIENSPTEAFIKAIDAYPPSTRFFLATDSPEERAIFLPKYDWRMIAAPTGCYNRGQLLGIQEAFREFVRLAACSEILGSAGSSFSEMAAAYGGCPLRIISAAP